MRVGIKTSRIVLIRRLKCSSYNKKLEYGETLYETALKRALLLEMQLPLLVVKIKVFFFSRSAV